jgi:ATPase subunit of ABC transporter with duplicated ATPase domains
VRFALDRSRRSELDPEVSVLESLAGRSDVSRGRRTDGARRRLPRQFGFEFAQQRALVQAAVGRRAQSGCCSRKLLCVGGNVLVLDEPTNDLDLSTCARSRKR